MDRKRGEEQAPPPLIFGDMKRSPSELAMEELFSKDDDRKPVGGGEIRNQSQRARRVFADAADALLAGNSLLHHQITPPADHLSFPASTNPGIVNNYQNCIGVTDTPLWSQTVTSRQSSITATIDSQSSICVGRPNSGSQPKDTGNPATGATSGSSCEQSDDDDMDTEASPCEQGTDPIYVKRIKRMISNRESARRSRRKKQAHLQDLERQVERMQGENATLFKQLTNATHQFKDATTNNRVLKSDVEALRAKVKLAEDIISRGSLNSSLSHLQNHLSTPQPFSSHNMPRLGNVTPTITVHGDDVSFSGITVSGQNSTIGLENADTYNGSCTTGNISEALSCVSETWPWESHAPAISK
ncbi:basic leucine zipper 9-like [Diospyros lotus]|uniref:basic leucine zipper 9-like n=1 Tax=Diospyros lotus TaxID=55363 RepID=UPI00225377C2|nr:basic leucine zipper 9-like [Diospyros lotus]